MTHETENQIRLRRAKEILATNRMMENQARKALAEAIEASKLAKERYEELFVAEDKAEFARRKAAYYHCTI